jgi:uncharacterized iron-regulated membrane protein
MNERLVFIGVIIVLVAVLGLAGGYILLKNNPQTALTSVNQNNTTAGSTNSPQTTSQSSGNNANSANSGGSNSSSGTNTQTPQISESQALSDVQQTVGDKDYTYNGLNYEEGVPYYVFEVTYTENGYVSHDWYTVNAITGDVS